MPGLQITKRPPARTSATSRPHSGCPTRIGVLAASTQTPTVKPSRPGECPKTYRSTTRPPSRRSSNLRSTPEPRRSSSPHWRGCEEGAGHDDGESLANSARHDQCDSSDVVKRHENLETARFPP